MLRQLLLSPTTADEAMSPAAPQNPITFAHQQSHIAEGGYYGGPPPPYDAPSFNSVSSDGISAPPMHLPHQQPIGGAVYQQDYPIKVENEDYAVLSSHPSEQQLPYGYQQPTAYSNSQSLSGIPEMFSSTYAVLSGDSSSLPENNNWQYYQSGYPSENGYYQNDYQNQWNGQWMTPSCTNIHEQHENATQIDPYQHDFSNDSGISSAVTDSSPQSSTPELIEKVLCIACKGLYPSKRSLTGHIGRNDQCREVIMQKCLEQPVAITIQTDEDLLGNFTSVCAFCEKFVSNFKTNIKRHLLTCSKSPHKAGAPSPTVIPHRRITAKVKRLSGSPQSMDSRGSPSHDVAPSAPPKKVSNTNNVDDPYICSFCTFVTVYKGNMKRHLGSCHQMGDEAIREAGGLDAMRASARDPSAPVPPATSARSYRGRKPKPTC